MGNKIATAIKNNDIEFMIKNRNQKFRGTYFIIEAAKSNQIEQVKLLIESGVDVNVMCEKGYAAIHTASANGRLEILRILIEAGADVNLSGVDNETALHSAAMYGRAAVSKILIDNGADVNCICDIRDEIDCEKGTPLHIASVKMFSNVETIKILIECGADLFAKTSHGRYAWDMAYDERKEFLVRIVNNQTQARTVNERSRRSSDVHQPRTTKKCCICRTINKNFQITYVTQDCPLCLESKDKFYTFGCGHINCCVDSECFSKISSH